MGIKCITLSVLWFVGQEILSQTPDGTLLFHGPTFDFANAIFAAIGIVGIVSSMQEFLHSLIK
jgi:hypothetical protein